MSSSWVPNCKGWRLHHTAQKQALRPNLSKPNKVANWASLTCLPISHQNFPIYLLTDLFSCCISKLSTIPSTYLTFLLTIWHFEWTTHYSCTILEVCPVRCLFLFFLPKWNTYSISVLTSIAISAQSWSVLPSCPQMVTTAGFSHVLQHMLFCRL